MNRILALQAIEAIGMEQLGDISEPSPSTCSATGCSTCSSYSNTGCSPAGNLMIAF